MELLDLNIQRFAEDGKIVISTQLDTKNFENGLNRMENTSKKAGGTIRNIVAGLGIAKLISKGLSLITSNIDDAVKRVDTLNNFPKVMKNLGVATSDAEASIKKMSNKLTGLPTTLDQGAMAVQRFTSKNNDVKKSTDIFLALNNAILAGGASTEIQASALEQMSQAYSKGKMDMMEWRAIQTAIPAQLNQVAKAMGLSTDQLGEMMRQGDHTKETIDEFLETIIKLNTKGSNGFQSFEKQARNSTAGIGTSITVAKTQIVKGVADIIGSLDKSLKKSGTSIGKIIANIGVEFKKQLDKIATIISKVNWTKVFETTAKALKALIPILAGVVTGFVAYSTAMKTIAAVNMAKNIIAATSALMGLTQSTELATGALKIYNMVMAANPWMLAVTAAAGLTVALIALSKAYNDTTTALDKEIQKTSESVKNYNDSMEQLNTTRDKVLKETASELGSYKDLWHELQNITDENGRVKSGYEERAKVITGTLSEALGLEIKMIDNQIQGYDTLGKKIDDVIAKKRAEAFMETNKEAYQKALKTEAELLQDVVDATEQVTRAKKPYIKELKNVAKETGLTAEEVSDYIFGLKNENDLLREHGKAAQEMIPTLEVHRKKLEELQDTYGRAGDALGEANASYEDSQRVIRNYQDAMSEFANGHYENVEKILGDTVNFTAGMATTSKKAYDEAVKQNNDAYKKIELGYDQHLQYMKEHTSTYTQEEIDAFTRKKDKKLEEARKERDESNRILTEQYNSAKQITQKGTDDQTAIHSQGQKNIKGVWNKGMQDLIKDITGHDITFKKVGKNQIQMYVDGEEEGKPMTKKKAKEVTDGIVKELNKGKSKGKIAGMDTVKGVEDGINYQKGSAFSTIASFGNSLLAKLKAALKEHSPSKATREMGLNLIKGFDIGIEKEEKNSLKTIRSYANSMLDELDGIYANMQRSIDLETGKMAANVQTTGTYQVAMSGSPTFNLKDNSTNETKLVVDGRVLAEVVNTENKNREVARS